MLTGRRSIGFIATTVCLVTLAGVTAASAQDDQSLQQINVMTPNETSCAPYPQFAAEEFGFWADEGIKVNRLPSATTVPYVAFLQNGDADVIIIDSGAVLQAVDADMPVKVVYEAFNFAPEGIVVLEDSPIKGLEDLRGKTIGLASDRDRITTATAMSAINETIDSYDISLVVVGDSGPLLASSLKNGKIDAFAGGGTDRAGIESAGVKIRNITPAEVSRNPGNSMVVWGPTFDEKRELIGKFLKGWAMGQHSGVVDTNLVGAMCKTRIPEEFEDVAVGMRMLNDQIYTYQLRRTHDYGEPQPDVWSAIQPPYVQQGQMNEIHDPATFIDDSLIEKANDWTTDDVKRGMQAWKESHPDALLR